MIARELLGSLGFGVWIWEKNCLHKREKLESCFSKLCISARMSLTIGKGLAQARATRQKRGDRWLASYSGSMRSKMKYILKGRVRDSSSAKPSTRAEKSSVFGVLGVGLVLALGDVSLEILPPAVFLSNTLLIPALLLESTSARIKAY